MREGLELLGIKSRRENGLKLVPGKGWIDWVT